MAAEHSRAWVAMSDTYDSHSFVQRVAGERHTTLLVAALAKTDSFSSPITVLDCGSATGLNSMKVFTPAFQAFREKSQTPLLVYHCDLPDNPWCVLFSNALSSPHSYLSVPHTYVTGIGRSYHNQLLPRNSVSISYTSYSVHWVSRQAQEQDWLQRYEEQDPALHAELRAISDSDVDNFLRHRCEELKVGGVILMHAISSCLNFPRSRILRRMQAEGLCSPSVLQNFPIFIYPVTPDSLRSVLTRHPSLRLVSLRELEAGNSNYVQFQLDGNREVFAELNVRVFRAGLNTMMTNLFQAEKDPARLVDIFFSYLYEDYVADPEPIFTREIDVILEKVG